MQRKGHQGKEAFISLAPLSCSQAFGCTGPEDPGAAPSLPVPDLFQQSRVFVVSKLASSRTGNVHDVGVRGHQDDAEWVLQLAAKGWGRRAQVQRRAPHPGCLSHHVRWGELASVPSVSPGGCAAYLRTRGHVPAAHCNLWALGCQQQKEPVFWASRKVAQKGTRTEHRTNLSPNGPCLQGDGRSNL